MTNKHRMRRSAAPAHRSWGIETLAHSGATDTAAATTPADPQPLIAAARAVPAITAESFWQIVDPVE